MMLIGGGETASDVVEEWCEHVDRLTWSIPRGMHFFRKFSKILPNRQPQALDKASSRVMKFIAPYTKSKPGKLIQNRRRKSTFLLSQGQSTRLINIVTVTAIGNMQCHYHCLVLPFS